MKYKIRLFAFCLVASICNLGHTTTGGPEKIELLGFDQGAQKIYFTRNYYDESARPPTLYYFSLNNKNKKIPVEVKSIYKNINNRDYLELSIKAEKEIQKIKNRLIVMKPLAEQKGQVHTLKNNKYRDIFG